MGCATRWLRCLANHGAGPAGASLVILERTKGGFLFRRTYSGDALTIRGVISSDPRLAGCYRSHGGRRRHLRLPEHPFAQRGSLSHGKPVKLGAAEEVLIADDIYPFLGR